MHAEELAEEVGALTHRLAEAQQSRNRSMLQRLVAVDYAGVDAYGRQVDRESYIESFFAPDLVIEALRLENVSIRVFEHVVVVTGVAHARFVDQNQPVRSRTNFTEIWVRRLMHWVVVAGHYSPAA